MKFEIFYWFSESMLVAVITKSNGLTKSVILKLKVSFRQSSNVGPTQSGH